MSMTGGHTETWYFSIPRYAMLHLNYRVNITPKRREHGRT